jgi:hypothetical protein
VTDAPLYLGQQEPRRAACNGMLTITRFERALVLALNLARSTPADHGYEGSREAAVAALKAQWLKRRLDPRPVP